jgi:hypothetical protein
MVVKRKGKTTTRSKAVSAGAKHPLKMYHIKIVHPLGPFPSLQACEMVKKEIKKKVSHAEFTKPVKGRGGYRFTTMTKYKQKVGAPAAVIKKFLESKHDVKATVTAA